MKKAFFLLALSFATAMSYAQNTVAQSGMSLSDYSPEQIARVRTCVKELFRDCPQYTGDAYLISYLRSMNRLEVKQTPVAASENYQLLSTVALKSSKCNPDLVRDAQFSPQTFNPFKYTLDFVSAADKTYRVDNTDYIIVIKKAPVQNQ